MTTTAADSVDLIALQAAILAHPAVADCAVVARTTPDSRTRLVAYVVCASTFAPERLRAYLDAAAGHRVPVTVVTTSNLPLTADGCLDEGALDGIPVLDDDVVARWREAVATIGDVSVTVGEIVERPRRLHLSDVLPGWSPEVTVDDMLAGASPSIAARPETESSALSISRGDDIREDPEAPVTLAGALRRAASVSPDKGLICVRADGTEVRLSYPALLARAERVLGGLRQLGLGPGDKALFQFDDAEDFTTAFWGCVLGGIVPVPLSVPPSYAAAPAAAAKLRNVWMMLKCPLVLSGRSVAADVRALANDPDMATMRVQTLSDLLDSSADEQWHESAPEDLALLLLTSGSTGVPKAVMQSHAAVLFRSAATAQMVGLTRDEVLLNWIPIDHVGGIVMMGVLGVWLACDQVHGTAAVVLQDPLKWLDWIDRYRVTSSWAPNFAYGLVNAHAHEIGHRRWDLRSIRVLINAGEAVVAKTARRFLSLMAPHGLRPGAVHPVWGMSETCSGVTFNTEFSVETSSDDDVFVEVGGPVPGFSMRITDAAERPVREGTVGSLQVKGPFVTAGYLENPAANGESFTADGWFRTGDLGRIRSGRLTITGREKDLIIVNGVNHHNHDIEKVVEETPGVEVSFAAAFAVRVPGTDTDRLAICFSPSAAVAGDAALATLLREIRVRVAQGIGIYPSYLMPVERGAIPKTTIGKIQRAELASRFRAGEFEAILRRVDILLENARTMSDWFSRRVWRPRRIAASSRRRRAVLALVDEGGVGNRVIADLSAKGAECVRVTRGPAFAMIGRREYAISQSDPAGYGLLMDALTRDGFVPDTVLHCWASDLSRGIDSVAALEAAQHDGLLSLLNLTQVLAPHLGAERGSVLVVASREAQVVTDRDLVGPHATLPGLLKTIPQEVGGVSCRHIDFDPSVSNEGAAQAIIDEIGALDAEPEVAYRDGVRYVSRLVPLDLQTMPKRPLPFKEGGCYLVTGGLGALGSMVARELLERFGAHLLLVGRSRVDDPDVSVAAREREARLEGLRAAGDVVYEAIDVADVATLGEAVDRACERWRRGLDGVIHLAGEFEERLIVDESPAKMLARMRAKLAGTWVLRRLVSGRPGALFLAFSSVNGFFGGFSCSAYSAANAYVDASAEAERRRGAPGASLAWSLWDDVGISRGYAMRELSRARGYLPIGPAEGRASLLAALHAADGHLLIGLDVASPHIRRFLETPVHPVQRLIVTTHGEPRDVVNHLTRLDLRDGFGRAVHAEVRHDARGADVAAGGQRGSESPRSDLERAIAQIWRQVLDVDVVDLDSNFFELGGTSLSMAQAYRRMKEIPGSGLVMTDLFRYPTVRTVCGYLTEGGHADPAAQTETDRDRGRRRRERLRRALRSTD